MCNWLHALSMSILVKDLMCPSICFSYTSSEETPPPHTDHEYAPLPPSLQDQLEEARKTITDQENLIAELQQQLFGVSNFQSDDKQISFYTGFPDYATFKAVFMALQPTAVFSFPV